MNKLLAKDLELYKRLLTYLKPHKKRFILAMLTSLPVAGLQGALAWMVGPFTDRLLKQQDFTMLYTIPVALIAVVVVQGICQYINEYYTGYIGQCITQQLRSILFKKLGSMDLAYFKKNIWSELCSRYCIDPAQLQLTVNDNLQDLIVKIITIIGLAGVLLYRNWAYAIVSLVILSTMVIPLAIISKKIRKMDFVTRELSVKLFAIAQELVLGIKIVKVFRLVKRQEKQYEQCLHDLFGASMRIMKAGIILKPLMQIISTLGISLVFVIGVYQINQHQMTPGDLTSFIVALVLLISPIKTVGSVISKMQRIFAPAERVFEKMDLEPDLLESPKPKTVDQFNTLEFRQVSFEYELGKPVLRDVSFQVHAGETIALVGPSGGGKSTLVDLIPRFMDPRQGQILLNGIDLRELSFDAIHALMAIVSQDAILFNTTIKENILLGNLNASDAEVRKALEMAYLSDWVDSMEKGWDTPVGEFGCLLSGGQKQRVTIARAFLKDAPVLILDEATSALDNESEAVVQQALTKLLKNRTVFVIAHRLSTIKHADCIMVLEKGHIIESGTHEQLLNQEGLYHKFYHLQFKKNELSPNLTPIV
jgi:subfamily B ATP-binding cassette protein MsbA